jgi:hypothetical protein
MEAVYGAERAETEMTLAAQELEEALAELPDAQKPLAVDPRRVDPDNTPSAIDYNRGALFHYNLERAFGRAAYDRFLASWFDGHAFESVTTEDFLAYLNRELIEPNADRFPLVKAKQWIYEPQPPADAVWPQTEAFAIVDRQREAWLAGEISVDEIDAADWTVDQWRRFLTLLPESVAREQMAALDRRFALTASGNAMIARDWFVAAVEHGYEPAYPAIEAHLKRVGRIVLISSIYEALARTPDGRAFAERVYAEARANYHPIARAVVDGVLERGAAGSAGSR